MLNRGSGERAAVAPHHQLLQETRDALSLHTVLLVAGVLFLQLAFIWSYVGAFHATAPYKLPIDVVAPATVSGQVASKLNALPGTPLHARVVSSVAAAQNAIRTGRQAGALVISPFSTTDTLYVATGGGSAQATALEAVIDKVEAVQHRNVSIHDLVPAQPGDARGLSGFYLVIGWMVGGYLMASMLGMVRGARPANVRHALLRLLALVPYAVLSGLGAAYVIDPLLGALTGHFVELWWLGALVVFASGAVANALQSLFGSVGVGITILALVVLGNPSAGGAYQADLLPGFWRALNPVLPNGRAVDAIRDIVYFGSHGLAQNLLVLAVYAAAGVSVALVGTAIVNRLRIRRPRAQARIAA